jgi:hypothetical protein
LAKEITITSTLKYSKNGANASVGTTFTADQTGDKYESGVQSIGTTEEALVKGDVGIVGYVAVRNLDATNFVQLGATAGVYSIKLLPGKGAVLPWDGTTVLAKADTAAVEVEYLIVEA